MLNAREIADQLVALEEERNALQSQAGEIHAENHRLVRELGEARKGAAKVLELEDSLRVAKARIAELDKDVDRLSIQLRAERERVQSQKAAVAEAEYLRGAFGKLAS
jgi:uncharacterized coiled-coil DUF342 family protein